MDEWVTQDPLKDDLLDSASKKQDVQDLDKVPLQYSQVLNSYVVIMTCLGGFMVNFQFTYFAPIAVLNYI